MGDSAECHSDLQYVPCGLLTIPQRISSLNKWQGALLSNTSPGIESSSVGTRGVSLDRYINLLLLASGLLNCSGMTPTGAWAARYLSMLIHIAGLPQDGDEHFFRRLYEIDASILDPEAIASIVRGYKCRCLGHFSLFCRLPITFCLSLSHQKHG